MEAYRKLYSDPRSPLSPIPPMMDQTLNCNMKTTPKARATARAAPRANRGAQPRAANINRDIPKKPSIRIDNPRGEALYDCRQSGKSFLHQNDSKLYQKRAAAAEPKRAAASCPCGCQSQSAQQQQQHKQNLHPEPKRVFRQASPVAARPLSPRMDMVLKEAGLYKYAPLISREEIDFLVFKMLLEKDLCHLGIPNDDIPSFMETIRKVSR